MTGLLAGVIMTVGGTNLLDWFCRYDDIGQGMLKFIGVITG